MEDEIKVLKLISELLNTRGDKIITRNKSTEALECIRDHHSVIDLVITDQTIQDRS